MHVSEDIKSVYSRSAVPLAAAGPLDAAWFSAFGPTT